MDDDKFDKNAPEKHPHAYAPIPDPSGYGTKCELCGRGAGHSLHEVSPRAVSFKFDDHEFVSARALRWVKGAPEPERHEFKPGNVSIEGVGAYCKSCGELAGNGNVHTNPPAAPHVFVLDGMGRATCGLCGGQEDDGKQHRVPVDLCDSCDHTMCPLDDVRTDQINQPAHYTAHPSGIECIQITEHMSFTLGNVIKYVWRADLKGDAVADLEKAIWYLRRELDRRNGK